jgi:hypothetical protein
MEGLVVIGPKVDGPYWWGFGGWVVQLCLG